MNNAYATLITQISLGILLFFSVVTWALLLLKGLNQWRQSRKSREYINAFKTAESLETALDVAQNGSAAARLGATGAQVLTTRQGITELGHPWNRQDLLERNLHQLIVDERRAMESGLGWLASIGSTAPFIGLFGTVFGIIHALSAISTAKSASIAVVAGPIGEALIATGVGIAVAVPAVLAYNFFMRRVKLLVADLDKFAVEFLNLSQVHAFQVQRPTAVPRSKENSVLSGVM
ncbi:MotA/TolQ/ExbB proton channel family protein [Pseudomonas capsici]|uniref:MotA/TolQ/ExbB proton channel family protein n=1 Tax=Pseudomonas capsici TaxID=2810614 RepID=UPI0021F11E6C|nr:MotA/TolQ/ExbB proton channel family protein [Pseudomonas capsici]MCV4262589.1 MotA/TolQ/ExbB proton channel family protein [Pseudomonas capsici]